MILLGFTSLYREGFEVVLFLQSYNLRLGGGVVLKGALLGIVMLGFLYDLASRFDPAVANTDYTHPAIARQLSDQGVRQLELDVWADPTGRLWRPSGVKGFKVFHAPGVRER